MKFHQARIRKESHLIYFAKSIKVMNCYREQSITDNKHWQLVGEGEYLLLHLLGKGAGKNSGLLPNPPWTPHASQFGLFSREKIIFHVPAGPRGWKNHLVWKVFAHFSCSWVSGSSLQVPYWRMGGPKLVAEGGCLYFLS